MAREDDEVDRVMDLLRREFPDAELLDPPHRDKRKDTVLFRAKDGRTKYELEVPWEAFEDHAVTEDLENQGIRDLLRDRPNMRLPYIHSTRRVLPEEQLFIYCDGKKYRIQQEKGRHVNIFDDGDRPLEKRSGSRVLDGSIHNVPEAMWHKEIRGQRGDEQ